MGVKSNSKTFAWPAFSRQRVSARGTRSALYVLSSHWDREWYQTFENFRHKLVLMMDHILDSQESGTLTGPFYCDGQAIILEDYLEVRPQETERVKASLRDGRLVAGPWYVLPDEFLVSGESLIRNLEMGRELVTKLGGTPSNCGFLCDLFGHNSQMPQILTSFGVEVAYIWRGLNHHENRTLWWTGADGTRIPSFRFGTNGYWGYAVNVRSHCEDEAQVDAKLKLDERLWSFLDKEAAVTEIDPVLLFDGADHAGFDAPAYTALRVHADEAPDHGYNIRHVSLDEHAAELLKQTDRIKAEVSGELIDPARLPFDVDQQSLTGGTLASRVPLKLANARCEWLLTRWAEPAAALATTLLGERSAEDFLRQAWRHLIQNHPHDSICGCSIDRVHQDMIYRFHQCEDIAERITQSALTRLAEAATKPIPAQQHQSRLVVFNPLPRVLDGVIDIEADLPVWPETTGNGQPSKEPVVTAEPYDEAGEPLAYQPRLLHGPERRLEVHPIRAPRPYQAMRYGFSLPLEIPALGWRSISLKQSSRKWIPSDRSTSLVVDGRTLENQSLRAVVQADGTIELTHLETGQAYSRLLALEDGADIGDGWRYVAPANDSLSVSGGAKTSVRVLDEGPYLGRLETRCQLDVPARYDGATQARSTQMVSLEVIHRVALRRDADWLEVETEVRNNACDHRLRVLIPTGATADTYWCDSPFDVVQRSIKLAEDHATWREPELESKPQQSWTAACDQQRGLVVISRGLRETAVLDRPDRAIALTLLRATQKTVFTDGESGGQLAGTHTFHYWIQPIAKRPDPSSLHDLATLLNAGVRSVSLLPGMIERSRVGRQPGPALPPTAGSLEITGPACLTAMRFKGDHMEIRLFNPLDTSCEAGLRPHASSPIRFSPGQSRIISLAGEDLGPLSEVSGWLLVTLGPKQVLTLRIATERGDSADLS